MNRLPIKQSLIKTIAKTTIVTPKRILSKQEKAELKYLNKKSRKHARKN